MYLEVLDIHVHVQYVQYIMYNCIYIVCMYMYVLHVCNATQILIMYPMRNHVYHKLVVVCNRLPHGQLIYSHLDSHKKLRQAKMLYIVYISMYNRVTYMYTVGGCESEIYLILHTCTCTCLHMYKCIQHDYKHTCTCTCSYIRVFDKLI